MKPKNKKIREKISLVFALIITVLLVILNVSLGLEIGVFNSRSIIKSINNIGYYDRVYTAVMQRTEALLNEVGLPETILSDIITPARVHADGMNYVNEVIKGNRKNDTAIHADAGSQTSYIHSKVIEDHILSYIEKERIENTSIRQNTLITQKLAIIAKAIENEYNSKVQLRFVDYLMGYKTNYHRILMIMIPCLLILVCILSYLLIRMYRHIYKGIRYIVYALCASSIITIIPSIFLLITGSYNKSIASTDYYNTFVSEYQKLIITVFAYIGMMGVLFAIALIGLIRQMREKIIYT